MSEIIVRIKQILSSPTEFFTKLKEEPVSKPYVHVLILAIPFVILSTIIGFFMNAGMSKLMSSFAPNMPIQSTTPIMTAIGGVASFAWLALGFWIISGILHLFFMIVGNKNNYSRTAQIYGYAITPTLLFGWIPLIGVFASIWTLVLYFFGAIFTLKLTVGRAAIALIVIPGIIFIIMMAIGITLLMVALRGSLPFSV